MQYLAETHETPSSTVSSALPAGAGGSPGAQVLPFQNSASSCALLPLPYAPTATHHVADRQARCDRAPNVEPAGNRTGTVRQRFPFQISASGWPVAELAGLARLTPTARQWVAEAHHTPDSPI